MKLGFFDRNGICRSITDGAFPYEPPAFTAMVPEDMLPAQLWYDASANVVTEAVDIDLQAEWDLPASIAVGEQLTRAVPAGCVAAVNGEAQPHIATISLDYAGPILIDLLGRLRGSVIVQARTWVEERVAAYPSVPDQLDIIYHQGVDGWKAAIDEVKAAFPKDPVK